MFVCVIIISGNHVPIHVFGFLPLLLRHHPALFLLEPIWTLGQCWLSHSHCVPSLSLRANEMAAGTMELIWAGLVEGISVLAWGPIYYFNKRNQCVLILNFLRLASLGVWTALFLSMILFHRSTEITTDCFFLCLHQVQGLVLGLGINCLELECTKIESCSLWQNKEWKLAKVGEKS